MVGKGIFIAASFAASVLAESYRQSPIRRAAERRQYSTKGGPQPERANAVKEAFSHAWAGYDQYCFPGSDELLPVSNTCGSSRNGWGASAADALSTSLIMGLDDIANQILDFIPTVDFSNTTTSVSLFETTIRYLGGMLAGYDLLNGPFKGVAKNPANVGALLTQSKKLADNLKFAFNTPSGLPHNDLYFNNQSFSGDDSTGLAASGTLILEWTHLSDLLGNDTEYADLASKAEQYLLNPKPSSSEPFPGLVGTDINTTTGNFIDAIGGWVGGDDSFYEYLIKTYVYDPSRFSALRDRWVAAADSSIANLASSPAVRPTATWLAVFNNTDLILESQHLACFDGGNFILGGAVLNQSKYTDFGLTLVDACHLTYNSTATKIGPEVFKWDAAGVPPGQQDFYGRNGFYIDVSSYDLRPEVIESYYYAYRSTGDAKYQDWAWDAFVAINATTRTDSGFSSISDVNAPGGGSKTDLQESFLFAEVLKYSYLIFADDAEFQVDSGDGNKWVYNTEAHPVKVAAAL